MKSKEELNKIKEEVEAMNEKLQELTPEELEQVTGGVMGGIVAGGKPLTGVVLDGSHSQCN